MINHEPSDKNKQQVDFLIRLGKACLKAVFVLVLIGYPFFVVIDFWSGLPGHYDTKTVEYGKGPALGAEYRCHNMRQSYDNPCSREQYYEQQATLLFLRPIFFILLSPLVLLFQPILGLSIIVTIGFLTYIFYQYDKTKKNNN